MEIAQNMKKFRKLYNYFNVDAFDNSNDITTFVESAIDIILARILKTIYCEFSEQQKSLSS